MYVVIDHEYCNTYIPPHTYAVTSASERARGVAVSVWEGLCLEEAHVAKVWAGCGRSSINTTEHEALLRAGYPHLT